MVANAHVVLAEEIVSKAVASQIAGRGLLNKYRSAREASLVETGLHTVLDGVAIAHRP